MIPEDPQAHAERFGVESTDEVLQFRLERLNKRQEWLTSLYNCTLRHILRKELSYRVSGDTEGAMVASVWVTGMLGTISLIVGIVNITNGNAVGALRMLMGLVLVALTFVVATYADACIEAQRLERYQPRVDPDAR